MPTLHVLGPQADLVADGDRALLADCGVYFDDWPAGTLQEVRDHFGKQCSYGPDPRYIPNGITIEAGFATHSHLDHIGFFPGIERAGVFAENARIFGSTQAGKFFKIHCDESLRRSSYLFDVFDANRSLRRFKVISPGAHRVSDRFEIFILPNNHMPGSYSLVIRAGGKNYLSAGDISWTEKPIVHNATLISQSLPKEWLPDSIINFDPFTLFGTPHDYAADMERLLAVVRENQKSRILIAALGVERGANVILGGLLNCGLPVYADGLIRKALEIFAEHQWSPLDVPISTDGIRKVKSAEEREVLAGSDEPMVIVTSAGMHIQGALEFYIPRILADENAIFITTSHIPEKSKIREIHAKSRAHGNSIRLDHRRIPLRCRVEDIRLSAHGDYVGACYFLHDLVRARGKKLERFVTRAIDGLVNPDVISFLKNEIASEVILAQPGTTLEI